MRDEIYALVPKDKANVWLYYNTVVAFDYNKTFTDKLFIDVVLQNSSYSIQIGNRDNDVPMLLQRLEQMGLRVNEQALEDKRYTAYVNLTSEDTVKKVTELNNKLK